KIAVIMMILGQFCQRYDCWPVNNKMAIGPYLNKGSYNG
ncbi:MAG: hypothetical protein ACI9ZD_000001, partial [Paracoccaceae bacterium]